jgi:hypothetical protein
MSKIRQGSRCRRRNEAEEVLQNGLRHAEGALYGLVVSQDRSGRAEFWLSAVHVVLVILALVLMLIADRQKALASSR